MRSPRRAAMAAITLLSLALGGGLAVAHADSSTVLYVDGSSASCTDSGTGAEAAPYCTIQAAADAAGAGDTVDIEAGSYADQVSIKSVGTAAAPVTFQAVGGTVAISLAAGQTGPTLTFDGASYVNFDGTMAGGTGASTFYVGSVEVNGSSQVAINGIEGTVHVTGTSSDVSLTRSVLYGVQIDSGSSHDVVSTNHFDGGGSPTAISVTGAPDTDITSNTILASPTAIDVSNGSTGTSIENNIVVIALYVASATPVTAVSVDASSASGSTLDYNVVSPFRDSSFTQVPYSWAGSDYATAAALDQATTQGAHDLNSDPSLYGISIRTGAAPEINSANASAPGMLATDFYGRSCTGDPVVAVTGAGTPADCARGAAQPTYSTAVSASASAVTALSVDLSSAITQSTVLNGLLSAINPDPTPAVSYTIAWGDGHTQTVQGSSTAVTTGASHTYAKAGTYTITDTMNQTTGGTVSTTTPFTTAGSGYTPLGPKRILDTRNGTGGLKGALPSGECYGMPVAGVDGIPAKVSAVALNLTVTDTTSNGFFSLNSGTISNLNYSAGQTVANSAIVPVNADGAVDVCSAGDADASADAIVDVTGYFTQGAGSGYQPTTPDRILDTRNGTGAPKAKVAKDSAVSVAVSGVDSIPAGITAVAVHVTAVDATGGGWIAAEPDGAGVPSTSSLNYGAGQTISNTIIVPVAADGRIELYNGAVSGSVDLIADVSAYFTADAPDAFVPVTPYRALDTRQLANGTVRYDSTYPFDMNLLPDGDGAGFPAGVTLAASLTTTDETANGALTVYPAGTTMPNVSALNYRENQNVADFGLFTTSSPYDFLNVYNNSEGSTDLLIDVFGYFANS